MFDSLFIRPHRWEDHDDDDDDGPRWTETENLPAIINDKKEEIIKISFEFHQLFVCFDFWLDKEIKGDGPPEDRPSSPDKEKKKEKGKTFQQ
jgi:hypothetical protein